MVKRHIVTPYVRVSAKGKVSAVRPHPRGVGFEFAEAPPPFDTVKLYRYGTDPLLDDVLQTLGVSAFATRPSGYVLPREQGPKLLPSSEYLVQESTWGGRPSPGPEHLRAARTLSHEAMHHVLEAVGETSASDALDRVYARTRFRHRGHSRGGI